MPPSTSRPNGGREWWFTVRFLGSDSTCVYSLYERVRRRSILLVLCTQRRLCNKIGLHVEVLPQSVHPLWHQLHWYVTHSPPNCYCLLTRDIALGTRTRSRQMRSKLPDADVSVLIYIYVHNAPFMQWHELRVTLKHYVMLCYVLRLQLGLSVY